MEHKYATAIVGTRGYSGLDLARILLKHPRAQLKACFAHSSSNDAAFTLSDYLPEHQAAGVAVFGMDQLEKLAPGFHTVFLATPAEASLELAPKLLKAGAQVIDLSGAFRLKGSTREQTLALYRQWYGLEHPCPELVDEAHYGLVPFSGPSNPMSSKPRLVANPGCYATSILMALLPLLKSKLIAPETLVIDAKSGTTGAGRKAAEALLFTEVEGECLPYKVGHHQHFPEICAYTAGFTGATIDPMFSTHLMNVRRGIISGLYARLSKTTSPELAAAQVAAAYASAYDAYPLARVSALSSKNERSELSLKKVAGSARVHIRYKIDGDKLYVFSLIDNLMKGAASQAIENFNRLVDLPAHTSLTELEGIL